MANPLDDLTGKNIIVDDVPMPDRKVLEFVAGDGATLEAEDDSVNGRTIIRVSATAGEAGEDGEDGTDGADGEDALAPTTAALDDTAVTQTLVITTAGLYQRTPAHTGNRTKEIDDAGATAGDVMLIQVQNPGAFTLTINNLGPAGGTMKVTTASQNWLYSFEFDGTDWVYARRFPLP